MIDRGRISIRGFRRLKRAARRVIDVFPLTPLGLVVLGGAGLSIVAVGRPRTDLILLVLGGTALALGALALALTSLTAAGLWLSLRLREREREREAMLHLECGFPSRTGFSMPALRPLLIVSIRWSWVSPEASVEIERRGGRLFELARAERRSHDVTIARRVEIRDAFGLTRIAFVAREARAVRALPSAGALKQLRVAKGASSGNDLPTPFERPEGELIDMRRYTPGDPVRLILWKTFAKTRQVVVRAPEQAISPARRTAAYLIIGEGDEAAAGAARAAIESGSLGVGWVLGADGVEETATTVDEALDVLALSGRAPPEAGGSGLAAFVKRHAAEASTRLVIFAPPSSGPWLDRAAAAIKARARGRERSPQSEKNCQVFVCIDGLTRGRRPGVLSKVLFLASEDGGKPGGRAPTSPAPPTAAALVRALSSAGAAVSIADRRAGRAYAGPASRALVADLSTEGAR